MNHARQLRSYRQTAVETASPARLTLMLYDGALRFMSQALMGFEEENFIKRNETIHNNIVRTQDILTELQATLDLDVEGDFPRTMFRLYDYMFSQLQTANMKKEKEPIKRAEGCLRQIRDAWSEMLTQKECIPNQGPQILRA